MVLFCFLDMTTCPMNVEHVQNNKFQKLQNFQSLNTSFMKKTQNKHLVSDLDSEEQCTAMDSRETGLNV